MKMPKSVFVHIRKCKDQYNQTYSSMMVAVGTAIYTVPLRYGERNYNEVEQILRQHGWDVTARDLSSLTKPYDFYIVEEPTTRARAAALGEGN